MDSSGLTLLHVKDASSAGEEIATLFATAQGLKKLRKKVEQFRTENTPDHKKGNETVPGRPKNADLVQSIAKLTEASLRALWKSPPNSFPQLDGISVWEVWLEPGMVEHFIKHASDFEVNISIDDDRLMFPEDTVVIARAGYSQLAEAIRRIGGVRALAAPAITAEFFDGMSGDEQKSWVNELLMRTTYANRSTAGFVTLMDTGVNRTHPLLKPALDAKDLHAANPAWAVHDTRGHGTEMAGLVLYGDLTPRLQNQNPVVVQNRIESVKILPDVGQNPPHLLGAVTRQAVDVAEFTTGRRRTFMMASTTDEDTPHDGAPTSWSSEIDQLAAGVSGRVHKQRLILVSVGNTDNFIFDAGNYLDTCDNADNEIESPSQAWNAISVGAFTQKTTLPANENSEALAPSGDLSPASRTASWDSHWPIKPDVVLEGGNWALDNMPPPMRHEYLSLLTTHQDYSHRLFTLTYDTSAATALASKEISELWSQYPAFWPETVRGLYVSSARWTSKMRSHLPRRPQKSDYARLFQRYGYGVPDTSRASRSAANALTLIIEDTIVPYKLSETTGRAVHNEMKIFTLPWPVEALRRLGNTKISLRVTLSSFIAPNPSESSRGARYCYASHNLRFQLNRADENADQFRARISKASEKPAHIESVEDDMWTFGSNRRHVGSLHIGELACKASDLAQRNLLAVHPVTGWWKAEAILAEQLPSVRYAMIVEINAEKQDVELYAEVQAAIDKLVQARTVTVI